MHINRGPSVAPNPWPGVAFEEPRIETRSTAGTIVRMLDPRSIDVEGVVAAATAGDAARLNQLNGEIVPFWCPTCRATYCPDHWEIVELLDPEMPDFFDEARGTCPAGHERMLWD